MNCSFQIILVSCISAIVLGQSTTCSNNNLLMTPTLRQKVLNVLNLARNKLESGQLLLNNGEYAVQAASLPDLTWSCELEEEMFERMEESCDSPLNADLQSLGLTWTFNRFDDSDAETLVDAMLENQSVLTGFYHVQLSRHNLYLEPISTFGTQIIALSDKAQYVACAIQNCNISAVSSGWALPGEIMNNIYCKVSLTEQLEFGDEIYQISPSVVNYIPPSQDVVCPSSGMVIEQREAVLEKINAARSQISQSNYPLPNGNNALPPAQPLSPLVRLL
uniref:SCP domain-containing protein n=1 Tax=Panagrolaimus superbus TaxID=310955 RepID=A0A914XU22_9BILA